MKVTVRYFASLREALGPSESVDMPPLATVATLRDHLIAHDARHGQALARGRAVRCAVNRQMAGEDTSLEEGTEVAFFPPVTGG
jgi:molybdopterin synthase sulfur carrier subunit